MLTRFNSSDLFDPSNMILLGVINKLPWLKEFVEMAEKKVSRNNNVTLLLTLKNRYRVLCWFTENIWEDYRYIGE